MATTDESHLFSLAALTTRTPEAPAPAPTQPPLHGSDVELRPAPEPTIGGGWPLFPLGAPLHTPLEGPSTVHPPAARGRSLALVVAASLLGAGIVAAAAGSNTASAPPARLAPEVLTNALPRATPATQAVPAAAAAPAPPEALTPPPEPAPAASAAPILSSKPPRRSVRPPLQATRDRTLNPPPLPTRGPCAHCSQGDLACNIKCRAGG